jgi:hypothetical protein
MPLPAMLLVAVLTFGACWGLDQLFTRLLRSQAQHRSGTAVRLRKGYAVAGVLLTVLSVMLLVYGISESKSLMIFAAALIGITGVGLAVYYVTSGIFYDHDSFLVMGLGKKSRVYAYHQIRGQLLYKTNDAVLVELYMTDGTTAAVQSTMEGAYPFLDHAFAAWCRQKGLDAQQCTFHDPGNHLWFPTMGEGE